MAVRKAALFLLICLLFSCTAATPSLPAPSVKINQADMQIKIGDSATFTADIENMSSGTYELTWYVNDKLSSNDVAFSYTAVEVGEFTIKIIITKGDQNYTDSILLKVISSGTGESPSGLKSLKIATFNIEDFEASDSFSDTAAFINEKQLDLIVFEEMQPADVALLKTALNNIKWKLPFIEHCSLNGKTWSISDDNIFSDYIIVFSKYPISNTKSIINTYAIDPVSKESQSFSNIRPVFSFSITPFDEIIWYYGVHLKSGATLDDVKKRRAQASALRDYINTNHDLTKDNIIILGDMNTMGDGRNRDGGLVGPSDFTTLELDYDITGGSKTSVGTMGYLTFKDDEDDNNNFTPLNYSYLPSIRTSDYNPSNYLSILDHLLISQALSDNYATGSIEVYQEIDHVSDHYPILAKLKF